MAKVKIRLSFIFLLFLAFQDVKSQDIPFRTLSEEAQISLITFSSGDAFYTAFGHTAIRVNDPSIQWDLAYNYGTFNLDDPAFYLNFVRGKLQYMLNRESFDLTRRTYIYFDRSITEQVLHLDRDQKQKIFNYLEHNARPENKFYKYSFFYDNCTTRARDVIRHVLGEDYSTNFEGDQRSFRELVQERGAEQPWTRLGAQLLLGSPADSQMDLESSAFLPDNLFFEFAEAKNGNEALVSRTDTLFKESFPRTPSSIPWPFLTTSLLLLVGIIVSMSAWKDSFKMQGFASWFDAIVFFIAGIVGVVLIFMWIGTDHGTTNWNINLAWALPTNLAVAYFISRGLSGKRLTLWLILSLIGIVIAMLLQTFGAQAVPLGIFPFVALLTLRAISRLPKEDT